MLTLQSMETITIDKFQENFEEYIDRVESGEWFLISSEHGSAMLIPHRGNSEDDDLVRIHTEHDEGC